MKSVFYILFGALLVLPAIASEAVTLLQENRLLEGKELCLTQMNSKILDKKSAFACVWIFLRNDDAGNAERLLEQLKPYSNSDEYVLVSAYKYAVRKNYDEADRLLKEIRSEKRETDAATRAELLRAEVLEKKSGLDIAAFVYKQLVPEAPHDPRLNWALGRWHLSRGETERAMEYMEKVTQSWPTHQASRFNLALIHLAKGKDGIKSAAKYLSECYKINKKDPEVLEQLGNVFELAEKPQQAIKYWQMALELNPKSTTLKKKMDENWGTLLDTLIEQKKFNEALIKIEGSSNSLISQTKYQLRYAVVLRNLGSFSKAAQKFEAVLREMPDEALAVRELGVCYLNLKKWDLAKKSFARAISLEPNYGMNYAWLAFVLEGTREWNGALEMWEKALTLLKDPKEIEQAETKLTALKKRLKKKKKDESEEE